MSESSLVEIARFFDLRDAHIAQSAIQACGMRCMIFDENLLGAQPYLQIAMGGVRLMVDSENADDARQLLARIDRQTAGSGDIPLLPQTREQWHSAILTLIMSVFAGPMKIVRRRKAKDSE
jgi:hypothetical protein